MHLNKPSSLKLEHSNNGAKMLNQDRRNVLLNSFRSIYKTEAAASRQLRRCELSILKQRRIEEKRKSRAAKAGIQATSNFSEARNGMQVAAEEFSFQRNVTKKRLLRTLNLIRAFLRGVPYEAVEEIVRETTLPAHRVILAHTSVVPKELLKDILLWVGYEEPKEPEGKPEEAASSKEVFVADLLAS